MAVFSAGGDGGGRQPEYLAVQFAKRLFAAACDCRLTNGCAWNAVSAFANCGRAVAHVRGSYGARSGKRPSRAIVPESRHWCATWETIA